MRLTTWHVLALLPLAAACSELPTEVDPPPPLAAKVGGGGPSYAMVEMNLPVGYTGSIALDISTTHRAVGYAVGAPGRSHRALAWDGASGEPTALPELAGTWLSEASAINATGTVGGRMDAKAVLWVPGGSGYTIVARDTAGWIHDVRDDGVVVGSVSRDCCGWENSPAYWDADGVLTELPLPASGQYVGGVALAINAHGDISGKLLQPSPGGFYEGGAVWIREGETWIPLVLATAPASGISDRAADGRMRVATLSGELLTFTRKPGTGAWSYSAGALPGAGLGMNADGAVAGFIGKRGSGVTDGTPYVLDASSTQTKLPIPKGKTGKASGVSLDLWLTGQADGKAAVWAPTR